MNRQPKITIEEIFTSNNVEERKKKVNEIFLQILKNSELQKIA